MDSTSQKHIHHEFDNELSALHRKMMHMGELVELQIEKALQGFEDTDSEMAMETIGQDSEVNTLESEIDRDCASIIARRQPAATDLRHILAISRCVFDLERIGDEALKIARASMIKKLQDKDIYDITRQLITPMGQLAKSMLHRALKAFADEDLATAYTISRTDTEMDEMFHTSVQSIISMMKKYPEDISDCVSFLWAIRGLERIGDHVCNILEHLVYYKDGKDVRHSDIESGSDSTASPQ